MNLKCTLCAPFYDSERRSIRQLKFLLTCCVSLKFIKFNLEENLIKVQRGTVQFHGAPLRDYYTLYVTFRSSFKLSKCIKYYFLGVIFYKYMVHKIYDEKMSVDNVSFRSPLKQKLILVSLVFLCVVLNGIKHKNN